MDKEEKDHILELKKGSFEAFDKLYSIYKKKLYGFAIGYLKSREDAEDIVQEVFIKIWMNRNEIDESKSFNSYLFTISKNSILNYFRKKSNSNAYTDYIKNFAKLTCEKTDEKMEYDDLLQKANLIIDKLKPRQKEIYLLSRKEGLSNAEIAEKLGISKKSIENQISISLKFLRENFGQENLIYVLFLALFL